MPEIADPPAEAKTTPPAAHPGVVTIDLANLGKKSQPKKEETPPPASPDPTEKKTEPTDPPKETTPPAPTDPAKKPNDKEHNMAELRKAREAAEAAAKAAAEERDRLKAEFDALKSKAPELPEDVKTRLSEMEKEREELRKAIRQTDLARDPDFQAKYNKPITDKISTMGTVALSAGIDEAQWKNAVATWNEEQFAEWSEGMSPVQRVKFQAAWTAAVDLYQQQQEELRNADVAYQNLQKQREAEAENQRKQYFSQNEQLARSIMAEALKPEALKEYEDLSPAVETVLMKAARHEIPATEIFRQLADNQVLARVTLKQKSRIEELEAEIAQKDKKLSEQEAFIANQAGAVPRGDAVGSQTPTGKSGPIWGNIVVKTS